MTPPPAPVEELSQPPSQRIDYHVVSRGETLHTIAWRYELDYQALASLNDLSPPYRIRPGQRLRLSEHRGFVTASGARAVPVTSQPVSAEPVVVEPVQPAQSVKEPDIAEEELAVVETSPTLSPPAPETPAPEVTKPADAVAPSGPAVASAGGTRSVNGIEWGWPVNGTVTREYDASRKFKGVNIHAATGSPVVASADGEVVYAGSGLRGYGQLIILKHNDTYLSAYAHNKRILVAENQKIVQGDVIAEVGGDPADPTRLYFEIREHGKPIDPEQFLPAR
ncbi:MAG: peptigoglycan-binding protein LysM [Porticoccaceae bacterium]|nr:peptigoglycan-binding protein LysM [Porticoccaceae bacterium]